MKIRLVSDLHLEFAPFDLRPAGEDILIVAGDTAPGAWWVAMLRDYAREAGVPVLTIAGNHEFYRGHWDGTLADLRAAADLPDALDPGKVTFLEDGEATYRGVRFIGATLWTDCELNANPMTRYHVQQGLNDYRLIGGPANCPLRAADTIARHHRSRSFIVGELAKPFDGPTVVVSHHAPSPLSIAPQYRHDRLNPAYVSNLHAEIMLYRPQLWLHGHTHTSFDYRVGDSRMVCNPRGYVDENAAFNPNLIIEV